MSNLTVPLITLALSLVPASIAGKLTVDWFRMGRPDLSGRSAADRRLLGVRARWWS